MVSEEILRRVKEYIGSTFRSHHMAENTYHNITHTAEVVKAVIEIAKAMNVSAEDIELLQIAAWFHDLGYKDKCIGHEDVSVDYANKFLSDNNFPEKKIEKVVLLIRATKVPHNPQNLLEEIICDADLHHLGEKNFEEKGELYRCEVEKKENISFTQEEWLKKNLQFFNQHKFFTPYAKSSFETQKNININKIEKKLKKLKKKSEKEGGEKDKMENKKKLEKGAGRTIETMFRNTMRTHVSFSSMADTKANIMISVNTLILTILVTVMLRKLDTNPHLIIPTAMLTLTSLVTLVYAILVTRPKVTSGRFTQQEIKEKKVNLLFFGNFFNMSLKDFTWGMQELISDKDYLYSSMITDFYYLGQVLGTKYKKLRICYTLFMYGVIISVIAYAVAFMLYPEGTNLGPIIE
ncbi:MAG: Pycsar system effector family protein [Ignavibacteriaceae bacterium]